MIFFIVYQTYKWDKNRYLKTHNDMIALIIKVNNGFLKLI